MECNTTSLKSFWNSLMLEITTVAGTSSGYLKNAVLNVCEERLNYYNIKSKGKLDLQARRQNLLGLGTNWSSQWLYISRYKNHVHLTAYFSDNWSQRSIGLEFNTCS
jgi:hypothetical protein